jgi:hypothetical protein
LKGVFHKVVWDLNADIELLVTSCQSLRRNSVANLMNLGTAIALGTGIGLAMGAAFHQAATGAAIGVAVGIAAAALTLRSSVGRKSC